MPLLLFLFPRPVNDSENTNVLELVLDITATFNSTYRYACKCYQLCKSTKTLHLKYIFLYGCQSAMSCQYYSEKSHWIMWNYVLQWAVQIEIKSIGVKVSADWAVCHLEWLKATSVNQKKLHEKLLIYTNVGDLRTFVFAFSSLSEHWDEPKENPRDAYLLQISKKTNRLFSSWESIAKTFNHTNKYHASDSSTTEAR